MAVPIGKSESSDGKIADYTVAMYLRHDGEQYAPGETVSLTEGQAKRLVHLGAVKPLDAEAGGGTAGQGNKAGGSTASQGDKAGGAPEGAEKAAK